MKRFITITIILILCTTTPIFAHAGRTDTNGGHDSPDGYHYHHGEVAHQHINGLCHFVPQSDDDYAIQSIKDKISESKKPPLPGQRYTIREFKSREEYKEEQEYKDAIDTLITEYDVLYDRFKLLQEDYSLSESKIQSTVDKLNKTIVGLTIATIVILIVAFGLFFLLVKKNKNNNKKIADDQPSL